MISVLDGVDAGDRNQTGIVLLHADSDNLESITTPRSRADSTTQIFRVDVMAFAPAVLCESGFFQPTHTEENRS